MSNESEIELEVALDQVQPRHASRDAFSIDGNGALQYRFRDTLTVAKAAAIVAELREVQSALARIQR